MQTHSRLNDALSLGVISILITMKLCFYKLLFCGFIVLVLLPQYVFMHLLGQNASYPQVFYGATQTLCKLSVSLPELVIRLEAIEIALLLRIYNLSNGLVVPA